MRFKHHYIFWLAFVLLLLPLTAQSKEFAHRSGQSLQAQQQRAGLDAFLEAYSSPVYNALSHIYSFGMTEHQRFLVLAVPNHAYVQCLLHDNDTRIYCEASSGFYKNGQPLLSKRAIEAIRQQGFDMDGRAGNYSLDMPLHGDAGLRRAASVMLETLYLGYGADVGHVTAFAPLITSPLDCDAERPLADDFWRQCADEVEAGVGQGR